MADDTPRWRPTLDEELAVYAMARQVAAQIPAKQLSKESGYFRAGFHAALCEVEHLLERRARAISPEALSTSFIPLPGPPNHWSPEEVVAFEVYCERWLPSHMPSALAAAFRTGFRAAITKAGELIEVKTDEAH